MHELVTVSCVLNHHLASQILLCTVSSVIVMYLMTYLILLFMLLQKIPSEWARGVLSDVESLTEEKVDEVLNKFVNDFKEGSLQTNGWPPALSAYIVSKAALTAYTRVLAKKYPSFCINAVCPGFVKTDLNFNLGYFSVDEGAESVVRLALLPNGGPSGLFFSRNEVASV